MILRPVRDSAEDAEAVRVVTAAALAPAQTGGNPCGGRPPHGGHLPQADGWPPERVARHHRATRHLARTDPGGCWLAEDPTDGSPIGAAQAVRREGTWGLPLLAVVPRARRGGVGSALLARALAYGNGCLRGVAAGSRHPAAARLYRRAGLDVHPAMRLTGIMDPARLAAPDGPVIEGGSAHRDLLDSVDRRLRGGAHGADHGVLLRENRLLVCDDLAGSGYCYLTPDGRVELLAATSRRLATRLLTAALLCLPAGARAEVPCLTAEQQWALDVGFAAGLELGPGGYLCLRGMRPPTPYIPSATYL
ncbi:GNAT family N-acetyltransferase [Streptomyces sp. 549]|uniref:GNAT family N-acetyltransferase n=1 Tax=Streptomyces sp. 549 TaxID=3049076 RepID=UPI0024C29754|nr:GNAT family N-acetyltransferase [Streptomyces sp. 549]MDK1475521.1 GNAT family N-acetyltransferase [Streptomyces sp. 549]